MLAAAFPVKPDVPLWVLTAQTGSGWRSGTSPFGVLKGLSVGVLERRVLLVVLVSRRKSSTDLHQRF